MLVPASQPKMLMLVTLLLVNSLLLNAAGVMQYQLQYHVLQGKILCKLIFGRPFQHSSRFLRHNLTYNSLCYLLQHSIRKIRSIYLGLSLSTFYHRCSLRLRLPPYWFLKGRTICCLILTSFRLTNLTKTMLIMLSHRSQLLIVEEQHVVIVVGLHRINVVGLHRINVREVIVPEEEGVLVVRGAQRE